jgi:hypothetical protein
LSNCTCVTVMDVTHIIIIGECGSTAGWGTMLQARRSGVQVPNHWIFSIYLTFPAILGSGVYSASIKMCNRNRGGGMLWRSRAWAVLKNNNLTTICELSRQYISQPYRPPWPVVGIACWWCCCCFCCFHHHHTINGRQVV